MGGRRAFPTEQIPSDINDTRPIRYGMPRWCDLFTSRQLLGHLIEKGVDYNSKQTRWHYSRGVLIGTFGRHDYSLKWTFGEMIFTGPSSGAAWGLNQVIDAYTGIATLVEPIYRRVVVGTELPVKILHGTAAHLADLADHAVDLVCIDPPTTIMSNTESCPTFTMSGKGAHCAISIQKFMPDAW